MRRAFVLCGLAVAVAAAPAHADDPPLPQPVQQGLELVREARRLADNARAVRDFLYYLSDPRGFQFEFYQTMAAVDGDPILGPLVHNLADLYRHRTLETRVQVQSMADTATPASIGVGAGLTWDAPLCRLFEVQGSAQGFYERGSTSAALAWGIGGCLPLPFDTIEVGYRGRREVRRSLLASPVVPGERDSGSTLYMNLRFYRWLSENHQVDVAPMLFQLDWARSDLTTFQSWGSIAPVHWARRGKGYRGRDQNYDFVRTQFTTLGVENDGTDDPLTVVVSPLAVDGIAIGDQVAIGLDVGWNDAQWSSTDANAHHAALYLDASVVGGVDDVTVEAHARNAMQPSIDGQILDEDKLTVRVDVDRDAAWFRADGFVGRARLLSLERFTPKVATWGLGADLTMLLTEQLSIYARVEGARNIIVDAAAATASTALELRGTAGVTADLRTQL